MSDTSRLRHDNPNALQAGTRLGEFELLSLLGVGGFGIVYLAFDHALEREVAIKEYMPATLAGRTETMRVSLRSQSDAESFGLGLRSFVNEAKLLARFDHPSLLKVLRFWEANGTAYMAMPVMRGRTVKDIRLDMVGPPDEAWLRSVLMPLLGAIERLHSEGVYHRDIAPDNIQIEPDGRPVLLDFGAARRVLSDKSQALTAILKPAYAPIEQYGEAGSVRQGPWTDLYALGATVHYLLLGRPPPPATARAVHDDASGLTIDQLPGCSESFLHTIDWMLCPRPNDRPQSVAELRDVLEGRTRPPQRRAQEPAPMHWERTSPLPPDAGGKREDAATQILSSSTLISPGVTEHVWLEPQPAAQAPVDVALNLALDVDIRADEPRDIKARMQPGADLAPAAAPRRRALALPLAAVAAAAVAAAVMFWPRPAPAPVLVAPVPASAPMAGSTASAPAQPSNDAVVATPPPASAALPAAQAPMPSAVMPAPEPVKTVEVATKPAADKPAAQHKPAAVKPAPEPRPRPEPAKPPPAAAAVPAEPAVAAGPPPSCGPRESIRYHVCMERECGRGEFATHPACQRWKLDAK